VLGLTSVDSSRAVEHDVRFDAPKRLSTNSFDTQEVLDGAKLRQALSQSEDGAGA
jgi:hypothetical protein